jgi:hypothetical protein
MDLNETGPSLVCLRRAARHATTLSISAAIALAAGCGDISQEPVPVISATALDFGLTNCGSSAFPRAFTVSNAGSAPFTFTASLAAGEESQYVVVPSLAYVPPNGSVLVTVFSHPIPAISDVTTDLYGDTLTVTTDVEGASPHEISVHQTARGAVLEWADSAITFTGTRTAGTSHTQPLTLQNTGNAPVEIDFDSGGASDFSFMASTSLLAAGDSLAGEAVFRPSESGTIVGELHVGALGTLCQPVPSLTATGTGAFAGTAASVYLPSGATMRQSGNTVLVLLESGHVAAVGGSDPGIRGAAGRPVPPNATPNLVRLESGEPLSNVVELAGIHNGACARRSDGSVYCWGNLGMAPTRRSGGTPPLSQPFASRLFGSGVTSVSAHYGTLCVTVNGTVTCTSTTSQFPNFQGNIGDWEVSSARSVALHGHGGYALLTNGTVVSFGSNMSSERGNEGAQHAPPSVIAGLTNVTAVTALGQKMTRSARTGCALRQDNTVWCWGSNNRGRLGDGTNTTSATPVQVVVAGGSPLTNVTQISSGRGHTCALRSGGEVLCWGAGRRGRLGTGTTSDQLSAAPPSPPINNAMSIATGQHGACAVLTDRSVRCFGETPFSSALAHGSIAAFAP